MKIDTAQILSGDRPVDRFANHPRQKRKLKTARECQNEKPITPRSVWLCVGSNPANQFEPQRCSIFLPVFKISKPGNRFTCIIEACRIGSTQQGRGGLV